MKEKKFVTGLYNFLIYFVDVIVVFLSIYLTYMFRYEFNPPAFNYQPFIDVLPFILLSYIIFMYIFGLNVILKQSLNETIFSILLVVLAQMITTAFITYLARRFAYPRSVLVFSAGSEFVFLSIWRTIAWKFSRINHGKKDCIIIGEKSVEDIAIKIIKKQKDLYTVKYICTSNCENLQKYIETVDVIFLCNDVYYKLKETIVDDYLINRKSIYIIPDIYEIALLNSKLNTADDIPMLKVGKLGLTLEQSLIKRLSDIIISLIGILLTSPILILISIIIKLSDGGNIFFKQERVTLNEKVFEVLKFRTMVMNAEKLTGPVLAEDNDPRITKLGRFMRSTRIDELPQLFNILKGDMSIVGPRPERPYFVEKFKEEISNYKYRNIVKAGLTGLAQIRGKYTTTPEDKVRFDMIYIKNYSILFDIMIIFQTLKIIFKKESSEGLKSEDDLMSLIKKYNLDTIVDI